MSSPKKTITIFGATGNQGGSVLSVLLAHPTLSTEYSVRAVTRDPSKPSAQDLLSRFGDGTLDLVAADVNDPASLRAAVHDSHAVFAVTDYWTTLSKATEIQQGKNIVDACIDAGVRHLIWSGLPNATELTGGKLNGIEHFDSKAAVSSYAEDQKRKTGLWVTHVMPAYFMQNIKRSIRKPTADGPPTLALPMRLDTHIPMLDIRGDTGKFVAGAINLGAAADGKFVQAVSWWGTLAQVVEIINTVGNADEKVVFQELPQEVWQKFLPLPEHAQRELGENMTLIKDFAYFGTGAEAKQKEAGDRFVEAAGLERITWEGFVRANGPWKW